MISHHVHDATGLVLSNTKYLTAGAISQPYTRTYFPDRHDEYSLTRTAISSYPSHRLKPDYTNEFLNIQKRAQKTEIPEAV